MCFTTFVSLRLTAYMRGNAWSGYKFSWYSFTVEVTYLMRYQIWLREEITFWCHSNTQWLKNPGKYIKIYREFWVKTTWIGTENRQEKRTQNREVQEMCTTKISVDLSKCNVTSWTIRSLKEAVAFGVY